MISRLLFSLWVVLMCASAVARDGRSKAPPAEFRALWVDAFHAGIRSPQEVEQLVREARQHNFNAIFVQVRRRGDALYLKSFEPPLADGAYNPNFDALQYVIEAAHREGLEVHAWINAMPVWRDEAAPTDARHVFLKHGISQSGAENWLTASPAGEQRFPVGYFLDAGHPGAAAYVVEVYANVVRNYAVDGIHLDYIRYPETEDRSPTGATVGYNPVSLARFQRMTSRHTLPAPDDPQWSEWRRQQITQLVRRIYIEAKAINPRIKVSAAVIPWGRPPIDEKDFLNVAPMQRVFQNWHDWLQEGILDIAVPMNYAREYDPLTRGWFDGWIQWEKRHQHKREILVGLGAYMNDPEDTLAQIARARKSEGRNRVQGISFFSYGSMLRNPSSVQTVEQVGLGQPAADRLAFLVSGSVAHPGPFNQPVGTPRLKWIDEPKRGWLMGTARDPSGMALDGGTILLHKRRWLLFRRTLKTNTDGNGFFGYTNLRPGRYMVAVADGRKAEVKIAKGQVSKVELQE